MDQEEYSHVFGCQKRTTKNPPTPRQLHTAVEYNDCMFVFGGLKENPKQHFNDLHSFDFSTLTWTLLDNDNPNKPPGRCGHSAVVFNHRMWIFGGISDEKKLNDMWYWDFNQHSWNLVSSKKMPSPRWGHSAIIFKDSMYIFGGLATAYSNEMWSFSFSESKWTLIKTQGDPPSPRQFHVVVADNANMFIFGGFNGTDYCHFYKFQFERKKWCRLPPCEKERASGTGHVIAFIDPIILIHTALHYNNLSTYKPNNPTEDWNSRHIDSFSPRVFHSFCKWKKFLVIFGGFGVNVNNARRRVELNDLYFLGSGGLTSSLTKAVGQPRNEAGKNSPKKKTSGSSKKEGITSSSKKEGIKPPTACSFDTLPHDIKILVARYLNETDLISIGSTNKEWYPVGLTEHLWESHFREEYVNKHIPHEDNPISPHPRETDRAIEAYDDLQVYYASWKPEKHKVGASKTFWKEHYAARVLRGERGFTWIPSSYPCNFSLKALQDFGKTLFKVLVMGAPGSGRSELALRFAENRYQSHSDPEYLNLLGELKLESFGHSLEFDILDAGFTESHYRTADGFLLCYSISDLRTFDQIPSFIHEVLRAKHVESAPMVITGTKCDLWEKRQVTTEEGTELAQKWNLPFCETSSLTRANIETVFRTLAEMIVWNNTRKVTETNKKDSNDNQKCSIQ